MASLYICDQKEESMTQHQVTRQSSVDRVWALPIDHVDNAWDCAHQGSAILDHAEQHFKLPQVGQYRDKLAVQALRNARTDLKAVMEYLDGISEAQPMRQDQIREQFAIPKLGSQVILTAEVAAQVSESNEYLKRIADALEQLVHRGVPTDTPWSALADYEIVHVDGDRRNNEASNLRLIKKPEVPK